MKKAFGLFWLVFICYFIFAHPAIIYYNTEFRNTDLADVNPNSALFFLGLSFLLWGIILCGSFYLIYKYTFLAKKQVKQLMQNGKRLQATILEVKSSKQLRRQMERKTLLLEMDNFQQEKIWHRLEVLDSKPWKHRFETGSSLCLRVDPDFKTPPYLAVEGMKTRIQPVLFLVWLFFSLAIGYYYVFSYRLESAGYGWRFLVWDHPLIVSAGSMLFFPGIFYIVFKFLIFKNLSIGKDELSLKFQGKKTKATIRSISQTGTYINEQPQLKFEIAFNDERGNPHQENIKKIVPLIHLASLKEGDEMAVFYNPKDPKEVAFEEDLQSI